MKRGGRLPRYAYLNRHARLKRRTELRRKTPLRRTELRRMSERRRADGVERRARLRSAGLRPKRPLPAVPADVRALLRERSEGWCEIGASPCTNWATDPHHRDPSGAGGRSGDAKDAGDRLSDLLYVCRLCHVYIHANPALARDNGWLLVDGQEPTSVVLAYRYDEVLLDDAGGVHVVDLVGGGS